MAANGLSAATRQPIFDEQVAAHRPSELSHPLLESRLARLCLRVAGLERHQHADTPYALALLRARHERPCDCGAYQGDEIATPHGAYPKAKDHGRSIAGVGVGQWRGSQ